MNSKKDQLVHIRLRREHHRKLKEIDETTGASMTTQIRLAVAEYLEGR